MEKAKAPKVFSLVKQASREESQYFSSNKAC